MQIMRGEMKNDLLSFIPSLRAFAFCLAQDRSRSDELVHSCLIEIWSRHAGKKGLVLKIAAFNTLRRQFLRQGIDDSVPIMAFGRQRLPADDDAFNACFTSLPRTEREAISLIEVWGFDPCQAAQICDCDCSTINRRLAMAHCHLTDGCIRFRLAQSGPMQSIQMFAA
jgi:RNA polymerase sigma-70 factor (ECF subfamily)